MTISGQLVNLKFILGQKNQQSQKKSNENLHMALEPVLLLADKNLEPMSKVYQNSSFDPFLECMCKSAKFGRSSETP